MISLAPPELVGFVACSNALYFDSTIRIRMFFRGFLVFWLLLVVLALPAWNLNANYAITQYMQDVWQTDQGLPQNTVFALVQTPDGYLWLATQGGVVRFDGVRFVTFDVRNEPEIKSDWIDALLADREGTLWIGSYGGGLTSLRMENSKAIQHITAFHRKTFIAWRKRSMVVSGSERNVD